MTTYGDEFYRDILEGMAVYAASAFHRDILATLTLHQAPGIGVALNKNQMASKLWLADSLFATLGARLGQVLILGGWIGALGAVLLHDRRFDITRVVSVDIDPRCAPIAESLNATHVRAGRFAARTADMVELDYRESDGLYAERDGVGSATGNTANHGGATTGERADLVVNTSCEHLSAFERWYARIPGGQLLVLQSNDYFACGEHVNCVVDLAAFRTQAPLRQVLFAGERRMRRYTRFMLIGRK